MNLRLLLALLMLSLTACVAAEEVAETAVSTPIPTAELSTPTPSLLPTATTLPLPTEPPLEPAAEPLPTITIPISVYIIDDENGRLSSSRDAEGLTAVYEKVNEIWAQANIVIDVQQIERLTVPTVHAQNIWRGDFRPFFLGIDYDFPLPNASIINGFYAQEIGGPNGIVPFRTTLFFVNDTPSVLHERVTSHEIGHIFGLHHALDDPDRLMFSGTNGMILTPEEVTVARYTAQGLLQNFRQ